MRQLLSYLTNTLQVEGLRGIAAILSKLESTTLDFMYGVYPFYTRLAPSRTYNPLTNELRYAFLLIAAATFAAAIIVTWIQSRKRD